MVSRFAALVLLLGPSLAFGQEALPGVIDAAEYQALQEEALQQERDARQAIREKAKLLGYTDAEIKAALTPAMVRKGSFVVTLQDGTRIRFPWFRTGFAENGNANGEKAIARDAEGRAVRAETNKGGVRLHKGVFAEEVYALALKMDAKLAITGDAAMNQAFRGAKGGIGAGEVIEVGSRFQAKVGDKVDPASKVLDRAKMVRNFGNSYVASGARVGLGADIQAGDVNTKAPEMKVLAETYGSAEKPSEGVSGKELIKTADGKISPDGGIEYRAVSTGEGVWMSAKLAAEAEKLDLKRATVASQGWGEVGRGFGLAAVREGARVIAIQELWTVDGKPTPGLLVHPKGEKATLAESKAWLAEIDALRAERGDLKTYKGGKLHQHFKPKGDVSSLKVDVVGFNALGSVLNEATVPELARSGTHQGKRKILTEGANLAETAEGAKKLDALRGKLLTIPGDLANLGGVHVSNLEALQNVFQEVVSNDKARQSLEATMRSGWERALALAKKHGVSERKAIELLAADEMMKRSLQRPDATKTNLENAVISEKTRNRVLRALKDTAQVGRLKAYRRADGTLDWAKLSGSGVLREGGRLAHFGLALFLKEVAVVASTGDRLRIEEFFDGLMTTDFYKHYGLFVVGARGAEIGYGRYLQRYVKPRFLNGLLKTNIVLAAGLALPMIVEGRFEGKAFAISLTSLGLSSAAVQAGVRGIRWVVDLKRARQTGALAKAGLGATRLAKLGGWFYTAVELAVILYVAEKVETAINDHLDLAEARETLGNASRALTKALADPRATSADIDAALDAHQAAWNDYRRFLMRDYDREEALLQGRFEKAGAKAKQLASRREALLSKTQKYPSLKARAERRFGSVDNYAKHLQAEDERALQADVDAALKANTAARKKVLTEAYTTRTRSGNLLDDLGDADWNLAGGVAHAAGDPYGARTDLLARFGRDRSRAKLVDAVATASQNRLQTYDDQAELLDALAKSLRQRGQSKRAAAVESRRDRALLLRHLDSALYQGKGSIDLSDRAGLEKMLRDVFQGKGD